MVMLIKRLRLAWRFKVWPWTIPWQAVHFLSLSQTPTDKDIARTYELAKKHGREREAR